MNISIRLPFVVIRRNDLEDMKQIRSDFESLAKKESENLKAEYQKMIHGAYAGIVCDTCGKNVFRGEGTWVHGNGGKAYCLEPCWKKLVKELNKEK